MSRQIGLTRDEQDKLRSVLEEMEATVNQHPPMSQERLDIFHHSLPKIKAQLPPEKHAAVDRYAREVQSRFEAATRRQRARKQ
jgi:hypothetical protein